MNNRTYRHKIICCLLFLVSSVCAIVAHAIEPRPVTQLVLTIINHSDKTLHYTGIHKMNPGNTFTLTTNDILPGGTAMLIANTTPWFDLVGDLRFSDGSKEGTLLRIVDPQQIRTDKTSTFIMNNARFISFIAEQAFNPDSNPRSLVFTNATIEIQNRLRDIPSVTDV